MPSGDAPEITAAVLAEAEKLFGLRFDDARREQVLQTLPLLRAVLRDRRAVHLPNALGPSLRFDPRLAGERVHGSEGGDAPFVRSADEAGPLPDADADIAFAPVSRLSRWIECGALSSTRIVEIYLERLRRLGPGLECVVTTTESRARAEAKRADDEIAAGRYRGPLHGVPWGAKDLLDTAGDRTTWGAAPYRDRVATEDAEVVRRLSEAGAVLIAKLSLGELAMGDRWFDGRTRNPWQPERGSGGSSAGSAAATAAGLVGFSIGSETLGSIANPCMVCGTTGLRPTFGRVPRNGAMALCWSLDKLGPIGRTAEDTALVLEAIRGPHPDDVDTIEAPFGFDARAPVAGRRVAYVAAHFEAETTSEPERAALDALRDEGLELVPIELPELPAGIAWVLVWVEAAAAFQALAEDGGLDTLANQTAQGWPNLIRLAHYISAVEYVQLDRVRHHIVREMRRVFDGVDAIAAPGMGHTFSMLTNLSGHPSLTQRVGFLENGTPVAVTLHAGLFDEGGLCRIGQALERSLGVWDRRPPGCEDPSA